MEDRWKGRPAFILAGGPSVRELDLTRLAGHRVVAINSAWRTYPAAEILFYADGRWWREHGRTALGKNGEHFGGEIVTTAVGERPQRATVRSKVSPRNGLSPEPGKIALERSSVTGAINELVHRGSDPIVLLGVDGRVGSDGARHHHGETYRWPMVKGCFDDHAREFARIAPSVAAMGVTIINGNPDSAITVWPRMTPWHFLEEDRRVEA